MSAAPGTESLGDQGCRDRRAGGGADIERDTHQDHDGIRDPAGVLVGHEVAGYREVDEAAKRNTDQQGEQDIVGDVDEAVTQNVSTDGCERDAT